MRIPHADGQSYPAPVLKKIICL